MSFGIFQESAIEKEAKGGMFKMLGLGVCLDGK